MLVAFSAGGGGGGSGGCDVSACSDDCDALSAHAPNAMGDHSNSCSSDLTKVWYLQSYPEGRRKRSRMIGQADRVAGLR